MNTSEQEAFFGLAIKIIGGDATDDERRELGKMLSNNAEMREEFEAIKADMANLKETLEFHDDMMATAPVLPAEAKARLQATVREVFPEATRSNPAPVAARRPKILWLKFAWPALAMAAAVVFLMILIPQLHPSRGSILVSSGLRGGDEKTPFSGNLELDLHLEHRPPDFTLKEDGGGRYAGTLSNRQEPAPTRWIFQVNGTGNDAKGQKAAFVGTLKVDFASAPDVQNAGATMVQKVVIAGTNRLAGQAEQEFNRHFSTTKQ